MKKMTLKQAVQKWVSEFNQIPQSLIVKAYPMIEDIEILSTPKVCGCCGSADIGEYGNGELYCLSCGGTDDITNKYGLPMWGYMWTFKDSFDVEWAKENIDKMADCGFWVYQSDELGLFFGIDGAGYDFYESHWIPLYKATGLKWHSED
ncbi:hypothetical protein MOD67_13875 [Bacillus licheniformis]|uniref:hypothetical protein n=1 Tax=Bacillus TaxID=1386 RepID=UPI002281CB5B|nr:MULTISPECIES: hypothetical protein [Bacillus]MCY7861110.1 hypothetical protein [Bacillus haynesii]MCY8549184.1 hypothetical protein [Bacillus haynesii]MCY8745069.1 hypothetical protein [Bacillus licheniformis]